MERLTERTHGSIADELVEEMGNPIDSVFVKKVDYTTCEGVCRQQENCDDCPLYEVMRKLADYEDSEEQGLLLRLPCKVGDNIFVLVAMDDNGKYTSIKNDIVECIYLNDTLDLIISFTWIWHDISATEIGKTVFLTREEAETALAEMQKG